MILHGTSATAFRLEAMCMDPAGERSPSLLFTEEMVLLEISVEHLETDVGRTTSHTKRHTPAVCRSSFAALDGNPLPRRDEPLEGTRTHMPREDVGDGMV
jgi:hypothetical protein